MLLVLTTLTMKKQISTPESRSWHSSSASLSSVRSPCFLFVLPFIAVSHSRLISRGLKANSLFTHPTCCLFCWKALWHRSVPTNALSLIVLTLESGVILSTAFVHLLQDAFDRLQDPDVKRYTGIGHWTGLIVSVSSHLSDISSLSMQSLLSTCDLPCRMYVLSGYNKCSFNHITDISTAYVDHLHSYPSEPSTPKLERTYNPYLPYVITQSISIISQTTSLDIVPSYLPFPAGTQ